jgi:acid stress chaperone HdeB
MIKQVRKIAMKPSIFVVATIMLSAMTSAAKAQVVVDLSLITCKQLLESDQERQTLISSWMAGYFSASKNLNIVDFRYVKRNGNVIGKYCKTHKSDTVMNAMQKNWR